MDPQSARCGAKVGKHETLLYNMDILFRPQINIKNQSSQHKKCGAQDKNEAEEFSRGFVFVRCVDTR